MTIPLPVISSVEYGQNLYSTCYEHENYLIIQDHGICEKSGHPFDYDLYTQFQNRMMRKGKPLYRFLDDTSFEAITEYIEKGFASNRFDLLKGTDRAYSEASALEHFFEQQFLAAFGEEGLSALHREYPLTSQDNTTLFLDYAIKKKDGTIIAVEENGITYHHPQIIGKKRYLHQLEKQNICTKYGITLYRLSSIDCRFPDRVIDEIRDFFGDASSFEPVGLQVSRPFALYEHQRDAVSFLKKQREQHTEQCASLIVLPTASGKSEIIIDDISSYLSQNFEARAAVVAPTVTVAAKWEKEFKKRKLEVETGTYHLLWSAYKRGNRHTYDYLCIDEAHHAVSPMTKKAISYLNPTCLVGLTATPDRLDRKRLEDLFGNYTVGLTIKEAMTKGIINTLRVLRVETNISLEHIRFNGKDYVNADLEKRIEVPTRDETVAEVLHRYFNKRSTKGVIFCVSIRHAKNMAETLNSYGLSARSVSSQDKDSEAILHDFSKGSFNYLCSCNMLNEGWDEKDINVMVMARPTMSKVLYTQQLGRGLRKSGNKGDTYVIDVVDQYGALARPWSAHALFDTSSYVPFGVITQPYTIGDTIEYLGITEKVLAIQEVDPFTFEKTYGDYLSTEETARELFINTGTLNSWVKKQKVTPDLTIPFGSRSLNYFAPDSLERIREEQGLKKHTEESIKDDFFEFLGEKSYTFSFKIIFLLSLLAHCDTNGEAEVEHVLDSYISFFQERLARGLPVDRESCVYTETYLKDRKVMLKSLLSNPFEKFERKRFIYYGKDVSLLSFHPGLWQKFTPEDIQDIRVMMENHKEEYYESLGGL